LGCELGPQTIAKFGNICLQFLLRYSALMLYDECISSLAVHRGVRWFDRVCEEFCRGL
jgi:hypothetical protein